MPDTFITQHTLGSVSSIQDLEVFKGSPQPERSSEHGSQLRWRRVEHTKCAGRSRELSDQVRAHLKQARACLGLGLRAKDPNTKAQTQNPELLLKPIPPSPHPPPAPSPPPPKPSQSQAKVKD